jgi:hypothetical protein
MKTDAKDSGLASVKPKEGEWTQAGTFIYFGSNGASANDSRNAEKFVIAHNSEVSSLRAQIRELERTNELLLKALQQCYLKHHCNYDDVGWDELSDIMQCALCETMGDTEFVEWGEKEAAKHDADH